MVLEKKYVEFLAGLASVLIHELSHAKAAYERGYVLNRITLMPYGAVLKGGEKIDSADQIFIAAAGPGANAALCLALYALWWRFPVTYAYTEALFDTSLAIGLFNLLPLYPLDGARIVLAISKKPLRALKALRTIPWGLWRLRYISAPSAEPKKSNTDTFTNVFRKPK